MELTTINVTNVYTECLLYDWEDAGSGKVVQGAKIKASFSLERLENNRENIESMLSHLHPNFKEGWSFLNLCVDRYDNQWCDLHWVMDQLVCLGLAIDRLSFPLPREIWEVLPGAMPYVQIKNQEKILS